MRVLTVCTHNRTRSVMMAALVESMLTSRLGPGSVTVESSGFGPPGLPAIDEAIAAMARRDLDVTAHRSRVTTVDLIDGADVIVTAERDHVVRVAALSPPAFGRAVTLPELLERAVGLPSAGEGDVRNWMEQATSSRTAVSYLRQPVAEVVDPTGFLPEEFEQVVVLIEQQCIAAADLLARIASVAL